MLRVRVVRSSQRHLGLRPLIYLSSCANRRWYFTHLLRLFRGLHVTDCLEALWRVGIMCITVRSCPSLQFPGTLQHLCFLEDLPILLINLLISFLVHGSICSVFIARRRWTLLAKVCDLLILGLLYRKFVILEFPLLLLAFILDVLNILLYFLGNCFSVALSGPLAFVRQRLVLGFQLKYLLLQLICLHLIY